MTVSSPALQEALGDIVGRDAVSSDPGTLAAHAVDGVVPRWVARPGGVEEVSRLLALASAEKLAVASQGSRSSLALGNPPTRLDLALDLSRLTAVTEHVPADMVASAQAGVSLAALGARLGQERQMLPIDPPGGQTRTLGGVLATHAAGPLRFRYGTSRDLLLGVRFVQADGTVTWGGARVVKSVTGYDVPKLLVGSLGTLGVIVEATLRLHPVPPASGSWRVPLASPEAADGFLAALLDSTLQPDRVALLSAEAGRAVGPPASGPQALISVGSVEEAVASQGAALERLARAHGSQSLPVPASAWEGLGAVLDAPLLLKLACEPSRVGFWLAEVERLGTRLGLRVSVVAEAGSGVSRAALWGSVGGLALSRDLLGPAREALAAQGGSMVVERAPAAIKGELDVWGPISPETLAIMKRLKQEFDPQGVLNPGRFVGRL